MKRTHANNTLVMVLSFVLTMAPLHGQFNGPGGAAESAPQSAAQIQALVAPIALYPDALVAQILSASTLPDQVLENLSKNLSWTCSEPARTSQ